MSKFFSRNLDRRGRLFRGIGGLAVLAGGLFVFSHSVWAGTALILAGGFMLYEAVRGWCIMRACGIKTRF